MANIFIDRLRNRSSPVQLSERDLAAIAQHYDPQGKGQFRCETLILMLSHVREFMEFSNPAFDNRQHLNFRQILDIFEQTKDLGAVGLTTQQFTSLVARALHPRSGSPSKHNSFAPLAAVGANGRTPTLLLLLLASFGVLSAFFFATQSPQVQITEPFLLRFRDSLFLIENSADLKPKIDQLAAAFAFIKNKLEAMQFSLFGDPLHNTSKAYLTHIDKMLAQARASLAALQDPRSHLTEHGIAARDLLFTMSTIDFNSVESWRSPALNGSYSLFRSTGEALFSLLMANGEAAALLLEPAREGRALADKVVAAAATDYFSQLAEQRSPASLVRTAKLCTLVVAAQALGSLRKHDLEALCSDWQALGASPKTEHACALKQQIESHIACIKIYLGSLPILIQRTDLIVETFSRLQAIALANDTANQIVWGSTNTKMKKQALAAAQFWEAFLARQISGQ